MPYMHSAYALLNLQYRCTWVTEWTACRLRRRPPAGVLIQLLFFQTMASNKSEHGVASRRRLLLPCVLPTRNGVVAFSSPFCVLWQHIYRHVLRLLVTWRTPKPTVQLAVATIPISTRERRRTNERPIALVVCWTNGTAIQFKRHRFQICEYLSRSYAPNHHLNSALHSTELTAAAAAMGRRGHGEPPPPPVSDASHHQSSRSPRHGVQPLPPDTS